MIVFVVPNPELLQQPPLSQVNFWPFVLGLGGAEVGNGAKPICSPAQPGCWIVAPLWPQAVQRAHWRSLSLDVPGPHRMTGMAQASGAWWRHLLQ